MKMHKFCFFNRIKHKVIGPNKMKNSIKISVVVPTYNTDPEALKRLINSIDNQTMPKEEYEVIFIDDGSTTDIFEQLTELAVSRSNVTAKRIPNSGWGSKPRNIGTKIARGVYILYLDHDDLVFPEAFDRVYQFGIDHNADVINPKEVRTNGWSWGWDPFKVNEPSAEKLGIQSLIPMTPHKFYRRKFLLDNKIKFNEGARVLWEDVYFNTKVFTSGASVAILSDYPTYYWIATGVNNSNSFDRDPHERWNQIQKLLTFFIDTIPNEKDLTFMLTLWYQSRVLAIFGPGLHDKDEERISIEFEYAKNVAAKLIPISIDENVTAINKVRAFLLRNGKLDELKKLAMLDQKVTARGYATEIRWVDGKLQIDAIADLTIDEKSPFTLHYEGERMIRSMPDDLQNIVPTTLLDLTNEIEQASFEASIKGRDSRVTWQIPVDSSEVKTEQINSSELALTGKLQVKVDIQNAAMGESLDNQPWDLATRFSAFGYTFHRGMVAPNGFGASALINGYTAVAYCNKSKLLSVDIGSKVRSIVGTSKPNQSDLTTHLNADESTTMILNLPSTHVYGYTKIEGAIEFKASNPDTEEQPKIKATAYLIGDEKGARVEATLKLPKEQYRITTIFEGRKSETGLYINGALVGSDPLVLRKSN